MTDIDWLDLDGTDNARDLGGLPLGEGGFTRGGRLLRSDNLGRLSAADVKTLVDDIGLRTVIDLRTDFELERSGPNPLLERREVEVHHLSLLDAWPASRAEVPGGETDPSGAAGSADRTELEQEILPEQGGAKPPSRTYDKYLLRRPDSVVAALRFVAHSPGASIVHCAAGKDRTGVVVAMALAEVGVIQEAIVADYVGDADRIITVLARLAESPVYDWVTRSKDVSRQIPVAATMSHLLETMDADFGGVGGWLRQNGWDEGDAAALRRNLVG